MIEAEIASCISVAHRLCDAAHPIAMAYFRSGELQTESKTAQDAGYDPVTLADRAIEAEMRDILGSLRPEDGILGEEWPDKPSANGLQWVLDPIDGTRAFISGLPSWGVLVALNDGDKPVIGMMLQPFTGERFVGVDADTRSSTLYHGTTERSLRTSATERIGNALMCCTAPDMFSADDEIRKFTAISERTRLTRFGTDCYGYAMLAMGQVDLVVEASLKPYDIQALMPLVRAAGGVVTNWQGGDCQHGGQVIAAANPVLHEQALALLA